MARIPQKSVFLEKRSYRQRRLRDVARMLPVLGVVLWLLPLGWRGTGGGTGVTLAYVFGVWLVLIVIAGLISTRITPDDDKTTEQS